MNLGELRQAIIDDISVETTDVFYTTALLNRYINRAVKWAANFRNWQETQRAVKRDSEANQEYYNYPENFKTDSIEFLTYNGKRYKKVLFREYEEYKEDHSNGGNKKIWADYRRRYFIHPTPPADGTKNILIWGHEVPDELSDDADEHPFDNQSMVEEAIQLYALGLTLRKGRGSFYEKGRAMMGDALVLLTEAWDNQLSDQADYMSETTEAFEHTDLLNYGGRTSTKRGSFEQC